MGAFLFVVDLEGRTPECGPRRVGVETSEAELELASHGGPAIPPPLGLVAQSVCTGLCAKEARTLRIWRGL